MTRRGKCLSALTASFAFLAACDGSDGILGNPQSQFGSAFAAAFNTPGNGKPKDGTDLAIEYRGTNGVDPTATPINL